MYRIRKRDTGKLNILLKQPQRLFHTKDLAKLWGVRNPNTLYTTIKRYTKKKILFRIQKGLYATVSPEKINPVELGLYAIHRFAYLSTESILAREGVINQYIDYITLVSSTSQKFTLAGNSYIVRKMHDRYLHNSVGITEKKGVTTATVERAVADLLYYNPKSHLDNKATVNWDRVAQIQKEVGFK